MTSDKMKAPAREGFHLQKLHTADLMCSFPDGAYGKYAGLFKQINCVGKCRRQNLNDGF